jgi:hypothetical protein
MARNALFAGLAATFVAAARPARAQGPMVDAGAFTITHNGAVVGREDFTIRRGRSSGPDGYTIAATVMYPPARPQIRLAPVVELSADSLPVQVQFDIFGIGPRRVYIQFNPRRITVRVVRPGGESARELPASGRELVADDSVFALYALLPAGEGFQVIAPRDAGLKPARLTDEGMTQTTLGGVVHELRHVVLHLGQEVRHLWFDRERKLQKVEVPSAGLVAELVAGPA